MGCLLVNRALELPIVDRAVALLKGPDPEFLQTQARRAFLQGKKERAIQLETEALGGAEPQ
jgi:hypothetical protein